MATETLIDAGSPVQYVRKLRECWTYRDLLWMMAYRDIRVRYAQTVLGMGWAVINPVLSMVLLYFVFGVVTEVDTGGVPALAFTMAGLCAWNYFSRVVGEAGASLIGSQSLVKKVYFPRLIIPMAKAISALIDLGISLLLLAALMIWYGLPMSFSAWQVIPLLILTVLAGLAFGVWVSALTIRFRDFTHVIPLLLRIGMFMSPIAYGASMVPASYRQAFNLNPLTGIIEGIRHALFGLPADPSALWTSVIVILAVLGLGVWYFLRMDKYIADIL